MIDEILKYDEEGSFEENSHLYILRLQLEGKSKPQAIEWIKNKSKELKDIDDQDLFLKEAKSYFKKW